MLLRRPRLAMIWAVRYGGLVGACVAVAHLAHQLASARVESIPHVQSGVVLALPLRVSFAAAPVAMYALLVAAWLCYAREPPRRRLARAHTSTNYSCHCNYPNDKIRS